MRDNYKPNVNSTHRVYENPLFFGENVKKFGSNGWEEKGKEAGYGLDFTEEEQKNFEQM